jgi:hypothetical protein
VRLRRALSLLACAPLWGGCLFAAPTWKGPPSDHFDGKRFFNPSLKTSISTDAITPKPASSVLTSFLNTTEITISSATRTTNIFTS